MSKNNNDRVDLSIIIISYNTQDYTLACLDSVYKETTEISFEVILLDNASTDNTVQLISKKFPQVKLIASDENYGFARGNNIAAGHANGDYLLLLNPDTLILNGAIDKLLSFTRSNPRAGITGGRTIFPDKSLNRSCYSMMSLWSLFCSVTGLTKILSFSKFFNPVPYGNWKCDKIREVDVIEGCFLMLSADLWKRLKGFNPLFFMYAEEVDLCLRAAKLGYKPMFYPDAEIIHYSGASEKVISDRIIKTYRGEITLMKEHWPEYKYRIGRSIYIFRVLMKIIVNLGISLFNKKYAAQLNTWKEVYELRKEWKMGWQ